ncbi:hypothetical protein H072_10655 [Dactylellina haptotyla CBS 200.50]|uniref:Rhodanese domain-containing protein n=1 Tax=Dactylellina haptotyla (strain CBS 200.50) TaxID=1284197 RepID=S8A459_DACHA|nr:hypothetical protein H072_10655 [Dactylellina haptotyla CBS 200.50]
MKFTTIATALFVAVASATELKYDTNFDYSTNLPLTSFACSDGANGLITKTGAQNAQQLKAKLKPNTYIVAGGIQGWNSPNCGQCWRARAPNGVTAQFVLIDKATPPYIVGGTEMFKLLSPSKTLQEGHVTVYVTELSRDACFK